MKKLILFVMVVGFLMVGTFSIMELPENTQEKVYSDPGTFEPPGNVTTGGGGGSGGGGEGPAPG